MPENFTSGNKIIAAPDVVKEPAKNNPYDWDIELAASKFSNYQDLQNQFKKIDVAYGVKPVTTTPALQEKQKPNSITSRSWECK